MSVSDLENVATEVASQNDEPLNEDSHDKVKRAMQCFELNLKLWEITYM